MSQVASEEARPLRADARRNREKVLEAARAVFSEQGRDAQIDDVARRAEVGVGTVYRHFPTKEALIEALVVDNFQAILAAARDGLDVADPWDAFERVLWRGAAVMAGDRALSEVFAATPGVMEAAMPAVEGLQEVVGELMRRAQAAGLLRDDLVVDDIPMVMCGIGAATRKQHTCPEAWRRHLQIVLDGLRAPAATGALPD
jgi:AcrR family transcriptional regulator